MSTLELVRPRSVGAGHAALATLRQLGFEEKLSDLGFSKPQVAAAVGNAIGCMAAPGSELAAYGWQQNRTALGELIGYDYEGMDLQRLYRSADRLLNHRDALESHLFKAAQDLLGFSETITLYDLTNTYFEGSASGIEKAKNGKSKEKRSDCPLVTLALVLDASGFPKRSQIFEGNVSEAGTLKTMLEGLGAKPGAVAVMDAGIATEANMAWLKEHGYHYVVVSRKRARQFDPDRATEVQTAGQMPVHVQRVQEPDSGEVLLYCYSPAPEGASSQLKRGTLRRRSGRPRTPAKSASAPAASRSDMRVPLSIMRSSSHSIKPARKSRRSRGAKTPSPVPPPLIPASIACAPR